MTWLNKRVRIIDSKHPFYKITGTVLEHNKKKRDLYIKPDSPPSGFSHADTLIIKKHKVEEIL